MFFFFHVPIFLRFNDPEILAVKGLEKMRKFPFVLFSSRVACVVTFIRGIERFTKRRFLALSLIEKAGGKGGGGAYSFFAGLSHEGGREGEEDFVSARLLLVAIAFRE